MIPMKYVFNNKTGHFVLLPKDTGMQHSDIQGSWTNAGFVKFEQKDGLTVANCYGESESLHLKAGDIDSQLITRILNRGF